MPRTTFADKKGTASVFLSSHIVEHWKGSESATPIVGNRKGGYLEMWDNHLMNDKWKVLQSCASQSMHSRMAQRMANQKRMLSSVNVTFRITLTIKRSIRKTAMTETTVTTCGVTIFEVSQMAPITMGSRIVSSMKRVQPKRRTCWEKSAAACSYRFCSMRLPWWRQVCGHLDSWWLYSYRSF